MKRSIVKQGAATMMISLPSKWVKKNKLEKGDEISLEEKANELIISTEKITKDKKHATINVTDLSPLVNRALMSLYIKGVDELEVNFKNKNEIEDFQKRVINELLGFEILKQTQNSIFIKDITGIAEQEIEEIVRRIFLILDSMAEELIIAVEKQEDITPVIETDTSVNKFVNFCLRILNKKGYKDSEKTPQIYSIVSSLEEIGDLYKKIAKEFEKEGKIEKNQISLIKEIRTSLNLYKEIFFNFDKTQLVKFAKKYEDIKSKIKQKNLIDSCLYELNETMIKMNNHLLVANI